MYLYINLAKSYLMLSDRNSFQGVVVKCVKLYWRLGIFRDVLTILMCIFNVFLPKFGENAIIYMLALYKIYRNFRNY